MIDLRLIHTKEEFEGIRDSQSVSCNYIHEYDKKWEEFPCLVVFDSYDESNGPYVFTYDFFTLEEIGVIIDNN